MQSNKLKISKWCLVEDGDAIKTYEFRAIFSESGAAREAEKAGKRGKNDDDDDPGDGKESNEELRKLISFKIKYTLIYYSKIDKLQSQRGLSGYHQQLFGWVVRDQSSIGKIPEHGRPKVCGMFASLKKSEVSRRQLSAYPCSVITE